MEVQNYQVEDLYLRCACLVIGKKQKYVPQWWLNGDLPWYKIKNHLEQIQDTCYNHDQPPVVDFKKSPVHGGGIQATDLLHLTILLTELILLTGSYSPEN